MNNLTALPYGGAPLPYGTDPLPYGSKPLSDYRRSPDAPGVRTLPWSFKTYSRSYNPQDGAGKRELPEYYPDNQRFTPEIPVPKFRVPRRGVA